jgi:hypothetical protein
MIDWKKLYMKNERFKLYVDKCARAEKKKPEDMFDNLIIQEVGKSYLENDKTRKGKIK